LFALFSLSHCLRFLTFFSPSTLALPQQDPKIEGIEKNYYEGDFLFGNCTSDFSSPPPMLAWYINDQKADISLLQPFMESTLDGFGFKLYQRSLEIRFRIDKRINPFITDGKVHMKCVAQIRKLPSQIREANHIFYVATQDSLKNSMLMTHWKNSGEQMMRKVPLSPLHHNAVGSVVSRFSKATCNEKTFPSLIVQ
jgi:hypothetical protein